MVVVVRGRESRANAYVGVEVRESREIGAQVYESSQSATAVSLFPLSSKQGKDSR